MGRRNSMTLSDRMKLWERSYTEDFINAQRPIIARIDGRAFHTWTKGMAKPYCVGLTKTFKETARELVRQTHAKVAYTQSDEISLLYEYEGEAQPLFGGKLSKLNSILASIATAEFIVAAQQYIPYQLTTKGYPNFDCRVFNVPDRSEVINYFLWRSLDCIKNSVSMLAQAYFFHKDLEGKRTFERKEMLREIGHPWEEEADQFRYGTFVRLIKTERDMEPSALQKIPLAHRPDRPIIRTTHKYESVFYPGIEDKMGFIYGLQENT